MTERRKNQSEEWTYFTLLFIYFITVNTYRFCISVIGYINVQIIVIGSKKMNIGWSLVINTQNYSSLSPPTLIYSPVVFVCQAKWWIWCYDWSDRLSVKLPAKGQLNKFWWENNRDLLTWASQLKEGAQALTFLPFVYLLYFVIDCKCFVPCLPLFKGSSHRNLKASFGPPFPINQ